MKIIKWFLIFFFYTSLIKLNPILASNPNLDIPKTIRFELSNSEYNKYMRRSMRAYTDGEIYGQQNIKKKYKKWIKASIDINGKKLDTEIRILGDLKDHLRPPQTSLKVKILNESYYGITRFNLFLPETRKGENEIFWTLLLNHLDFPSLFTRIVEVNLNGNIYKAILQEDATKEFLERNNLTETAIIKQNDFGFYLSEKEKEIYKKAFTTSFVIDNSNFLKNNISNFIVSEAISLRSNENFDKFVLNEYFFKSIHEKYASHGLGSINRKYIYIPYKKIFLPLYYDGNVQFLPGTTDCSKKVEANIISLFAEDYKFLTNKNLSKMQKCVFKEIYSSSINRLMTRKNFFNKDNINHKKKTKYLEIKEKIIKYLDKNEVTKQKNENYFEDLITYTFLYNDRPYVCLLKVEDMSIKICNEINDVEYSKLISESGRFKKYGNFKSFPINLGTFNKETPIIRLNTKISKFVLDKNATYYFIKDNTKNQNFEFNFRDSKSRLFIQGEFEGVNFNFLNDFKKINSLDNNSRYDKNLLTGCVNFFDSKFKNVKIFSDGMKCEDSVNIKNSTGEIKQVNIQNSSYDALDLDFSKLFFENVNIANAKNDCLDFSFGNYNIANVYLKNCGDKGLSVGERSKLNLENGKILNTNTGVASKDDSITNINDIILQQINVCLNAYNKKREFKGSKINVNNFNCEKYQIKKIADNQSEIIIGREY